jgi:hypothetical protein
MASEQLNLVSINILLSKQFEKYGEVILESSN